MSGGGALVLVGTPIGNMGDLSPRAAEALASADVVACEDSRRTGRLFELAGLERRPLLVIHDHNEASRVGEVLERLARGERVAVVTDAGMPGISDPGERLVRAAAAAGHRVEVVPGPSAAVAGLVVSGLPTGRFVYEGFLPRRGAARSERLGALAGEERTVVLFEAPHRLARTLADLAGAFGADREVAVGRELTKLHEEVWRGGLADASDWAAQEGVKGEVVLVVEGARPAPDPEDSEVLAALAEEVGAGRSRRDASAEVARRLGIPRRRAYELSLDPDAEGGEP